MRKTFLGGVLLLFIGGVHDLLNTVTGLFLSFV